MACIEKIKHDVPHCNSEKGLQVFYDDGKDSYTGYCFSCASRGLDAYVKDPYGEGGTDKEPPAKKTREQIQEEIREIKALKSPNIDFRGIPKEYFARSGVKMAYSEFDGKTPNSFYFPFTLGGVLGGYKAIVLNKKVHWSVGEVKDADLYNWEIAKRKGVKKLYVTEGEWDCHALEYMLESCTGGKYNYAVTSLPHGAGSAAKVLGRMRKDIEAIFEEVILVFDSDDAGRAAVKEVQKVLPNVLESPHISGIKDANEALQKGQQKPFVDFVLWKSRKPVMEGVITVSYAMDRGMKDPEVGYSYPWEALTEVLYGQKFPEAICVAGAVGSGKTLMSHEIMAWNMVEHKVPCFAVLLEEQNIKTLWNVAAKIDGIPYNRPEVFEANKERYFETIKSLEDKLFLWNSQGNSEYRFDIEEILSVIRYNTLEYGCKSFFIDNMTRLTDHLSSSETNEFINKYSSEIANISEELGINIVLFSHLNPPKGNNARSHEEGAEIYPSQLTGSRGVMRSFPTILGFERNQYAEGTLSNNSYISVLKNREFGTKKKIKTQYSPSTGRLLQFDWEGDSLY